MEETTIKIARRGSKGHLHNGYLGTEYIECLAETEDRFKLRFGAATVWVDKTFIDNYLDFTARDIARLFIEGLHFLKVKVLVQ